MNVLSVEDVWKRYLIGEINADTLGEAIANRWALARGRESRRPSNEVWALKGLNLTVAEGDIVGIIGRNGAGKSTLLKLLSRISAPTRGRIRARGRIASLLEVGTGFHPDLTGRENVFLNGAIMGMTRRDVASRLDRIIEFSGCERYIDTPVKRYSSGMIVRLGFSVSAHLDCEIMIVDEVLAVGDRAFQDSCIEKIEAMSRDEGRTVLFVSHSMPTLRRLCRSGVVIEDGRATTHPTIDAAVRDYLGSDRRTVLHAEFPCPASSTRITRLSIDREALARGVFVLEIGFTASTPISPVPGVVVYNENSEPVFGSNTRVHPFDGDVPVPMQRGSIICNCGALPLHGGRYAVSAWLSDATTDYDAREMSLNFELPDRSARYGEAFSSVHGPLELVPRWTCD